MKKRKFVIGDIHGGYKALIQVLERAKITADDQLIFLGDYVDGWSEPVKVIDKLIELDKTHDCIFLRGNHDDLLDQYLRNNTTHKQWLAYGGQESVDNYKQQNPEKIEKHLKFLGGLKNYYIDSENRLFVHAGFSKTSGIENEYYDFVFYWDRTLWETALATDKRLNPGDVRYPKRFTFFEEIFIGHTPVTRIGVTQPYKALNVWNVDTGAAFKGRISMMEIDTKEVFQSDPVYTLYPEEDGRNK
ncbi:MAG TPA: metallophosphoesterase [Flavobacteriaceae bacterium]|nr:metallophosphoesterase [Flavobacteriaceae bacterium]